MVKTFFKKLGGFLTGLRIWTVNIFTLLLLVYIIGGAVYLISQMPGEVDLAGKVLILNPEGVVQDQEVVPSEIGFPFYMSSQKQIQSRDLIRLIRAAAANEELAGVLLDFSKTSFSGGSTVLRIAEELSAIRGAGKPVIAYSDALTTSSYLMAAQADEIYVHPSGAVAINGLGGYRDYTRELTDKLKITIHNYSQGDYKSASEGLTRSDMSEADRTQRREIYGPIWTALKSRMAKSRGLEADLFQNMADTITVPLVKEGGYDSLAYAVEQGVISGTKSFPQLRALMIEKFGRDDDDGTRETYPHISWDAYLAQLEDEEVEAEESVAVVFVEGVIQQGKMGPGVAGSDSIAPLIRKAHENENTRALVLRVNSPGGSIIASDLIRDELVAAKNKGLPVIVSMGDVAASGGVWISTPADRIYAEPTTITGSIGVAVAFPTLENVFDYVGVNFDGVTTSKNAGWGINQGIDEQLDAIFARWAGSAYNRFIEQVAQSREKDTDYIRSIAGGRVWLAPKAKEIELIDELGTMEDAIAYAASQAGLEEYRVNYMVQEVSPVIAFLRRFSIGLDAASTHPYGVFGQRIAELMKALEGINQPRAAILCAECMVEVL